MNQTFHDRLLNEKKELDERVEKLKTFLNSEKVQTIEPVQGSLLQIQLLSMETYSRCLAERIVWFKSPESVTLS